LILPTYLRLGLPSGLFPSGFPTNILYAFLFSPIRATWPAHLILFYLITLIILGEESTSNMKTQLNTIPSQLNFISLPTYQAARRHIPGDRYLSMPVRSIILWSFRPFM
jgi:hypothetical protein